jgi:predicted anti-sigma-YlaC factor YlaD
MPVHFEWFRKWVRQIYTTQDEELDCDGCFEAIPEYVDMEVAGEKTNPRFPEVELHLRQCPQCYDLYLTLRDVALLESRQVAQQIAPQSVALQPDSSANVAGRTPSIGGVPLVL